MKKAYIKEGGKLISAKESKERVFCGYYAAIGYNGGKAGDLFAVLSGPVLVPAYDRGGKRINVGKEFQGMSYDEKQNIWYNE